MKMMFVGDLNLGEYYTSFGNGPGTFAKSKSVFSAVQDIFSTADMVVGNLEASITDIGNDPLDPERMVLKVNPAVASQFKEAGFGVLQVANNHSIQHGPEAFQQSLTMLDNLGIRAVGLNQQQPVIVRHNDISFGFLAASDVPDNTDKSQSHYQRMDSQFFDLIANSVSLVDHLIVMLHWGLEASTVPLPYQREIAKKLKDLGVRAIIGSHTHLFYEVEASDNFICAYSLGNFVFDLCWDKRLVKSGILELEFTKEGVTGQVWPIEIRENGCLPSPSGNPVPLNNNVTLYDHGSSLKWQQTRKVIYLLSNILKGDTPLKIRFFKKKFLGIKSR